MKWVDKGEMTTKFYPFVIQLLWWRMLENWILYLFDIRLPCFISPPTKQKAHSCDNSSHYFMNKFLVAIRLFGSRWQISECGKNKKAVRQVFHWCSDHIVASSMIYYWTDRWIWNLFVLYINEEVKKWTVTSFMSLTSNRS